MKEKGIAIVVCVIAAVIVMYAVVFVSSRGQTEEVQQLIEWVPQQNEAPMIVQEVKELSAASEERQKPTPQQLLRDVAWEEKQAKLKKRERVEKEARIKAYRRYRATGRVQGESRTTFTAPKIGMTKVQVENIWGRPAEKITGFVPSTEGWFYGSFNRGNPRCKYVWFKHGIAYIVEHTL